MMRQAILGSAPTSLPSPQSNLSVPLDIATHLNDQVGIVSDLYDQNQQNLSRSERDWVQNAVSYTKQILQNFYAIENAQVNDNKPKRLYSLSSLSLQTRQMQSQATIWSSQFLIAMQDLSTAMNMLTWCAQNKPRNANRESVVHNSSSGRDLATAELSNFLNRRKTGGDNVKQPASFAKNVEDTIFELRATSSLLRSASRPRHLARRNSPPGSSRLPLSLVETVEIWRQNAEDALRDTMRRYFEQEELLKQKTEDDLSCSEESTVVATMPIDASAKDLELETPTIQPATMVDESRSTSDTPLRTSASRKPSDSIPRRKPVATLQPQKDPSPVSPATTASIVSPNLSQNSFDLPRQSTVSLQGDDFIRASSIESNYPSGSAHPSRIKLLPEAHPLQMRRSPTMHDEAQVSTVSLVSTVHPNTHPSSEYARNEPSNTFDMDMWQPEPRVKTQGYLSSLISSKKSRGRLWLERQAAGEVN